MTPPALSLPLRRRGRPLAAAVLLAGLALATAGCSGPTMESGAPTASGEATVLGLGSASTPTPTPTPSEASPPGGLYVGFYQEDREDNPEDPMPGSYYLALPEGDGDFSGAMSFSYIGCQDKNGGTVAGRKAALGLAGDWTGTVDGREVGGPYTGSYDPAQERYWGTYENADGKVHIVVANCVEFHVASHGIWEMSLPGAKDPETFDVTVEGERVTWTPVDEAAWYLVSVFDVDAAMEGRQAIVGQEMVPAGMLAASTAAYGLGPTEHVVAVSAFSVDGDRLGYTSRSFTP